MISDGDGGLDFDAFLERELRLRVGALRGSRPEIGQAAYRAVAAIGGNTMPLLSSLTTAASSKAAVGLATAALVVGGGSVAAAAASNSTNPADWGKTVTAAVANCKSQRTDSQHGIGQCVSAIASKKGQEERAAHAASSAREQEPAGQSSGHASGTAQTHSSGAPTSHPSGKPTDVPSGSSGSGGSHPTAPAVAPTPSPRHQ